MREILKALLAAKGIKPHSFYNLSGVPAATTYRYLKGDHGEPHSETIQKWARALGVSEAQLRGVLPIDGLVVDKPESVPLTLESVLTRDELTAIEGMRSHSADIRRAWLLIGKELCKNTHAAPRTKAGDQRATPDRRRGGNHSPAMGMKYRSPEGQIAEPKKA